MWWQYLLVFLGSFLFDVVPFPLPPAFTVMIFFQIVFGLDIWPVVLIGVAGSILGRYILTLYIPYVAERIFKKEKNDDVMFLGNRIKNQGWKTHMVILAYTLLPLPTTPLFLASGMSRVSAFYIIPAFTVGKLTSDAITVYLGKYATENADDLLKEGFTWKSGLSLVVGLFFLCCILFINWRSLIQKKKFLLNFHIWKKSNSTGHRETMEANYK